MEIRNVTGENQVLGGRRLPPDTWLKVPEQVSLGTAMAAWNMRIVDVRVAPDDAGAWWQEPDGTHILWQSLLGFGDGYGTAAENHIWALREAGVRVHVRSCHTDADLPISPRLRPLLEEPLPAPLRVGVCMATPPFFPTLPTAYRIGFTMYEADDPLHVHPEWRHGVEHADMLVVPSDYCREVFGGFFKRDIRVAPLIIDSTYCVSRQREVKDGFTFVSYGTLSGRKAPLETIDAFRKAFPKEKYPWVRLEFKTRFGVFGWGPGQLPANPEPERIVIHDTGRPGRPDWTPEKIRDWLLRADAMLFLSKGEGFGMPPREAMATGLPVILTNHTGLADIADARYNWPVGWKEERNCPLGGTWRPAIMDEAIDAMRWVVEHREEAYAKGKAGADWFIANHGAAAAAQHFIDILDDVEPMEAGASRAKGERATLLTIRAHAPFFEAVRAHVPLGTPILDVGVGAGIATIGLTRLGYEVYGIVEPGRREEVEAILKRAKVPVRLREVPLRDLCPAALDGWPKMGACVSVAVMQDRSYVELDLLVRNMVNVAPTWFAVPSCHYPALYSDGAKQWRTLEWLDRLGKFERTATYYGKGNRYVLVQVTGESRAAQKRYGVILDAVWRPGRAALAAEGKG